jgi:hypothetical protein
MEKQEFKVNYIHSSEVFILFKTIVLNNLKIFGILIISLIIGIGLSVISLLPTLLTISFVLGSSIAPVKTLLILLPHGIFEFFSYSILIGLNFSYIERSISKKVIINFVLLSFLVLIFAGLLETFLSLKF